MLAADMTMGISGSIYAGTSCWRILEQAQSAGAPVPAPAKGHAGLLVALASLDMF